jgi:cobalamin biosynthesis protein CobT
MVPEGAVTEPGPLEARPYEVFLSQVARQIHTLSRVIEEELRPVKRMGERRGYASGYKLDLRRLMRFHADYKDYDKLWLRKTVPDRWSVVFSLLVDLSGSMSGAKAEAAVLGSLLLAETLHRLNVPFLINGFQDVLVPFCHVGEGLTSRVRAALAQMPQEINGNRPGGNNRPAYNDDGPCLREAADEVLDLGYDERLLVVISDGQPEGCRSTPEDLRQTITELRALEPGLKLVAIGLGHGTEHVNDYYPEAKANVPVDRLAEEIGALLRAKLRAGRRRAADPI